jgi:hypothetical protein
MKLIVSATFNGLVVGVIVAVLLWFLGKDPDDARSIGMCTWFIFMAAQIVIACTAIIILEIVQIRKRKKLTKQILEED